MTSVDYYDWEGNFRRHISFFRIMGLWPKGESYTMDSYMVYCGVVVTLLVAWHILPQIINIYVVRNDLESVIGIMYAIMTECLVAIKVYYVLKNMEILKNQIVVIRNDWFQLKYPAQKFLIEPNINFWKLVYKWYSLTLFSCFLFYVIYPILDSPPEEKRLLFLGWYPYDVKISPFYEITYVLQSVSLCYFALIHLNVDTLIALFNVYAACQFEILCDSLKKFVSTDCDVRMSLIVSIRHHKEILGFVKGSTQFFSWIVFWLLILSGISLGTLLFQLTLVVPLSNEFYCLVSFISCIIIQIFMYCWFGNEVEVKSDLISYSLFESDWTELPMETKKDLLFFTTNVLKPIKISAFGIFQLSLDTFMKILKTAWSYFALLTQISS